MRSSGRDSRQRSQVFLRGSVAGRSPRGEHLDALDLAAVDHLEAVREALVRGVVLRHLPVDVAVGGQFVGRRHLRHVGLVLKTALLDLEGRGHVEDGPAVLDADDAARREAPPVADAVDVEEDRTLRVAAAQEVGVDRVQVAVADRLRGGDDGLAQHLTAEDVVARPVLRPEQVLLDLLHLQQVDHLLDRAVHRSGIVPVARRRRRAGVRASGATSRAVLPGP